MAVRRILTAVALATLVLSAAGPTTASEAQTQGSAKKRCKTVVKRIHGKKKRVRICRKVKPRAKVINVRVQLDPARATTLALTAGGGAATASAANGAKLTLTVPAGTAPVTSVRITPVKRIRGFPLRTLIAAVQLEPDGLQLQKPALLRIEPGRGLPRRIVVFAYSKNGRALHPYPFARTGAAISLPITHFSGYGVAVPGDGARTALVGSLLAEWAGTRAALAQALGDPASLSGALFRYYAWRAVAQGFPELAGQVAGLRSFVQEVLEQIHARCADQHDVQTGMVALRALDAAVQLGLHELQPNRDRVQRCLRFELDFDTVITRSGNGGGFNLQATMHVRAQALPLVLGPDGAGGEPVRKQIEYLSWDFHVDSTKPGPCPTIVSAGVRLGQPFSVERFVVAPGSVVLEIFHGHPHELVSGCGGSDDVENYFYFFQAFHPEARGGRARIVDWEMLRGSLWARKTYAATLVNPGPDGYMETDVERTTLQLRHTPQS